MSILTWAEAAEIAQKETVVFTNGVFDLLHVGHLSLLEHARSLGDVLIVGINSDASVKRLGKGENRPINTQENRARLLCALKCVDGVVVFDEDTPIEVIKAIRPAIHVKGGDYVADDLPEAAAVKEGGGRIVIVPLISGQSSTRMARDLGLE